MLKTYFKLGVLFYLSIFSPLKAQLNLVFMIGQGRYFRYANVLNENDFLTLNADVYKNPPAIFTSLKKNFEFLHSNHGTVLTETEILILIRRDEEDQLIDAIESSGVRYEKKEFRQIYPILPPVTIIPLINFLIDLCKKYMRNRGHEEDFTDDDLSKRCIICIGGEKTHLFLPCKHSGFCLGCVKTIRETKKPLCPLCRTPILGIGEMEK